MRTYQLTASAPRQSHPWTTTTANPAHRYVDLRAFPELIPRVLEDFRPYDGEPAVQAFYRLIGAINGDASLLESNDCAFTGPEPTTTAGVTQRLECSGRIGVLFRDLRRNTDAAAVASFVGDVHARLATVDPTFQGGAVATSSVDVDYRLLPAGARAGTQTLVWFWAWGDDPAEVFANLERVIAALGVVLAG